LRYFAFGEEKPGRAKGPTPVFTGIRFFNLEWREWLAEGGLTKRDTIG